MLSRMKRPSVLQLQEAQGGAAARDSDPTLTWTLPFAYQALAGAEQTTLEAHRAIFEVSEDKDCAYWRFRRRSHLSEAVFACPFAAGPSIVTEVSSRFLRQISLEVTLVPLGL